jgi:hypothetical protein
MKIISFAYTTPALLAGRKTRTRRLWDDAYAQRFHKGDLVQAWDHVPRVKGAKRVGTIRLTAEPRKEHISDMPAWDYEREGFAYLNEKGLTIWGDNPHKAFDDWREKGDNEYWVIDFELVKP